MEMLQRIKLECRGKEPEQVEQLNLDGCRSMGEIEGLEKFESLQKLSIINAGISTLKGFPSLAKLRKLELSDNRISGTLSCLKGCQNLTHLNLCGNKIQNPDTLETLVNLPNLISLDVSGCDVTKAESFRDDTFKLLKNLKYLDGYDVEDKEISESEEEEEGDIENGAEGSSDEENGEQSEEDSDSGDEEIGLDYLTKDNIEDESDDGDYDDEEEEEESEEEEDNEIEQGDASRGQKRKHEDGEET